MFYAFLLLGKKGPLAKVWLAAHWEKKLTKANVFETDVESSVERIKAPPVKISLRTSGHLLLGLSRIYLRKAKYLFQDCNEVFMKIRMAFRPGAVDLPPQTREADPQVITLPDLFRDFENAVADLNDVNLENEFAIPESRMREITMQDDSRNLDRLDNFMDMGGGFGEGDGDFELSSLEVLRDAIGPEDSILHESRDRPELDVSKAKSLKNDSLDQLSVEKAPNRVRESFGMGFGEMDGGFGPEHGELTSLEDLGMGLPSIDETAGLPLGSPQHDQTEDMETNQLPSDNNIIPKKRDAGSVMSDFTLASLDISTVTFKKPHPPGEEGTPVVKKRKSTIANVSTADVEVKLSTNEIRNWFEDQSDIEVDIISAPANKIALLPRLTSEQKPFEIPTSNGADEGLSRLVLLNCTVAEKVGSDDEDPNQSTVEDVLRGVGSMDEHISMADMDPITLEPIVHDQDTTNESHLLDAEDKHHTRESTAGFGEVGHDTYDQITGDPLQGIDMPTLEEEEGLMNGDEDLGPKEDERPDEYERRKWNKKTQQVLNQVSKAFGKKTSSVPFSKVLDSSSRKQAATNFFSLLLLTTRGSLKLQQDEPYGDLLITKGPAYQACIS